MKQFEAVTLKGKRVVVGVSPSGFIRVSNGEQTKSQALVSFARAYFSNPSVVEITPLEHGVVVSLADASLWFIDAETLVIMRLEEGTELQDANQQDATKLEQDKPAKQIQPQVQPTEGHTEPATQEAEKTKRSVNGPVNGTEQAKPKRGIAKITEVLSTILKSQGLSDEQVSEILNALNQSKSSPSRQVYKFDESTPEGKLMARLAKLHASVSRPVKIGNVTVTVEKFKSPNGLISYENKTIYARVGDEIVQFPPAN